MSKYFPVLLVITLAAFALVGCGSKAPETEAAQLNDGHKGESTTEHKGESAAEHDAHGEEAGSAHQEDAQTQLISFSKALQQEFKIQTKPVRERPIHETIRSLGEIKAAGTREAEVVAPFAGTLLPDAERGIVRPGQRVSKGDHLAILAPSTEQGGWEQLLGEYKLAKAEHERVKRLFKDGAVAQRRMQEAQLDLDSKEARLRAALGGADISAMDSTGKLFHLRASSAGILTDTHLRFGQHVDAGEHLFNIVDPSKVWLEAQVPASEAQRLDAVKDAGFAISGSETLHRTADYNGRLITIGGLLDPGTRRVPVIFEIDNPDNRFKPGSFAQIYLRQEASHNGLAVPQSALLDEDGIPVVIVQVGTEDFRKVVLKIGVKDEDYVEILDGLAAGDNVVTNGAYKVKLAATKTGGADAHAGHGH
jgi:membrane fusion protein, heavy metal efflux system